MNKIVYIFFALFLLNAFSAYVKADIDAYTFSSEQNQLAYLNLTKELRCPKCQNQDIKDSNAPIAKDMRKEVYRMVEEGKSHDQVVSFMVERFGEFVTYKPKVNKETYVLWFGPLVFVLIGGIIIFFTVRHKRSAASASQPIETSIKSDSSQRTKQVEDLLKQYDNSSE